MARRNQPWFRESKQTWYATIDGRKVGLGRDKDAAFRQFYALMAGQAPAPAARPAVTRAEPAKKEVTVGELARDYLAELKRRVTPRTHAVAAGYLKAFLARYGTHDAASLDRREVAKWIGSRPTWSDTTAAHVACRVVALYNWAAGEEVIPTNPLKGMAKPTARSRGAESVMGLADYSRLLDAAPTYLRDVLAALRDTGARPCEVLSVTAADFHAAQSVWVLRRHKTSHKTGKPRVVHLTAGVAETCQRLAAKYPAGPLYRTATGKPFPASYYLPRLVRELRRQLGLPESVIPYGLRHGFATDALAKGVPDALVAELLGHAGTGMLHRHYAHLGGRQAELRAGLGAVRG